VNIADIHFNESCCGGYKLYAEYIRLDGVGFFLNKDPKTGTYSVKVYATDGKTMINEQKGLNQEAVDRILNA